MKKATLILLIISFTGILLYSKDYYMEFQTFTKENQKESSAISKVWLTPHKIRVEQNDVIIILRNDRTMIFYAYKSSKKYYCFDKKQLFLLDILMNLMLSGTHYKIEKVQMLQKDNRVIRGWNCGKTRMTIISDNEYQTRSILTIWTTTKLQLGYSIMDQIVPLIHNPFSTIKDISDSLDGFPVLAEGIINLSNEPVHIKGELLKAEETTLNNDIFEIPKDYEEMKFGLSDTK